MPLGQPVPPPVKQEPVAETSPNMYATGYEMPYQAAPPPSPMIYQTAQPVSSQVAYPSGACELTPPMAYGQGYTVPTCPAAQTTYEPVCYPSTSQITYPPGSSWESTPRLYPLRDLSLSNTRYFDKRDPYIILLLVLAAHDIDFKYVKMADLSRQLPERHLWLKTPLDANAALQSYIKSAVELLEAFERNKINHRQHRPRRVPQRPQIPSQAHQRQGNRTPRAPQGSGTGSSPQNGTTCDHHSGGRSGIRRRNGPGWRNRGSGRSWRGGRNGQSPRKRCGPHNRPNGPQNAAFGNTHSIGSTNAQETNTGRVASVPKRVNDNNRGLSMGIYEVSHTDKRAPSSQPSLLQTSESNPSPGSSMTSYSSFSVVRHPSGTDTHPDPLSEESTMARDMRQALLSASEPEPDTDLNAELPSYRPASPLRSYRSM